MKKGLRLVLPDMTVEQGEHVKHIVRCVLRATNEALMGKSGFDIARVELELCPDPADYGPTRTGKQSLGLIVEIDV